MVGNWHRMLMLCLGLLGLPSADAPAEESRPVAEPAEHVFGASGGVELKAYVFSSPLQTTVMRLSSGFSVRPTTSESMLNPRAENMLATFASTPGSLITSAEIT